MHQVTKSATILFFLIKSIYHLLCMSFKNYSVETMLQCKFHCSINTPSFCHYWIWIKYLWSLSWGQNFSFTVTYNDPYNHHPGSLIQGNIPSNLYKTFFWRKPPCGVVCLSGPLRSSSCNALLKSLRNSLAILTSVLGCWKTPSNTNLLCHNLQITIISATSSLHLVNNCEKTSKKNLPSTLHFCIAFVQTFDTSAAEGQPHKICSVVSSKF